MLPGIGTKGASEGKIRNTSVSGPMDESLSRGDPRPLPFYRYVQAANLGDRRVMARGAGRHAAKLGRPCTAGVAA